MNTIIDTIEWALKEYKKGSITLEEFKEAINILEEDSND